MKTLLEILNLSASFLQEKGIERARREAEWLIADALELKRLDLYLQYDRPLQEEELVRCREAVKRRSSGEPSQYIAGKVSFGGCEFFVGKDVLIPRPETELLVEMVAKEMENCEGKILLDLCTGSGCIGISLKKRFPSLEVFLIDISYEALEVAKKNALHNNVEVTFLQGDLFEPFEGKQCDYFVCNPPYIAEHEYSTLAKEVREFEPKIALVSGASGYEIYEKIAYSLKNHLLPKGKGWLELGSGQGERAVSIFKDYNASFQKDWSGHDRYLQIFND
jgi:release factor glutamine methyltransferase